MADTDLSAQFEKISDNAKIATDKLKAASQKTHDQLETDAAHARDTASAAADQFKDTADAARGWGVVAVARDPRQVAGPCRQCEDKRKEEERPPRHRRGRDER
jgi:hypothetical protein